MAWLADKLLIHASEVKCTHVSEFLKNRLYIYLFLIKALTRRFLCFIDDLVMNVGFRYTCFLLFLITNQQLQCFVCDVQIRTIKQIKYVIESKVTQLSYF